jgi:hypothetical protein
MRDTFPLTYPETLDRIIKMLSYKPRTKREIRLSLPDASSTSIDRALKYCKEEGILIDKREWVKTYYIVEKVEA